MKSIEIGKSAVVASQAALGVMRMDALDADAAAEVVRTAAEHGVNFFDTAGAANPSCRTMLNLSNT